MDFKEEILKIKNNVTSLHILYIISHMKPVPQHFPGNTHGVFASIETYLTCKNSDKFQIKGLTIQSLNFFSWESENITHNKIKPMV